MLKTGTPSYFKNRRKELSSRHPDSAFLFPANQHFIRNHDVHYPYRQESGFYYLTGFEEPESFLILAGGRSTLFVQPRDPHSELWEGERYGVDRAKSIFQTDQVYLISELEKRLPDLIKDSQDVFYRLGLDESMDRKILEILKQVQSSKGRTGQGLASVRDWKDALGEMRLFKSAEEVTALKRAGEISGKAHRQAMQEIRPGMLESEAEAIIEYVCRRNGCARMGYGTIAAGGKNATCLHYVANNERLGEQDLLLIDAGGEFDYYTADITRTFPVGRAFSPVQKSVYELVLTAQMEALAMAKPGTRFHDIHDRASEVLAEGLVQLGLLKGKPSDLIKSGELKKYYPHGTGHWLGMDVHDIGLYKLDGQSRKLEPGMVFTIEPGLYFQADAPEKFRGIGIRIEDDILVTKDGHEVLTAEAPKKVAEIEALRK